MFNKSEKEKKGSPLTQQNVIAANTAFKGEIDTDTHFRIDGTFEGDLKTTGKVVVGKTGKILGNLTAQNADFEGVFSGILDINGVLTLKSTGKIEGEVTADKLVVESGALLNAHCKMGKEVKTLNNKSTSKSGKSSGKTQTA